jgi:hypothetical protein
MEIVQNQTTSGATVALDDKHFANCRFTRCTLIYAGGDFSWSNTTFENCQLQFAGAAGRTMRFLGMFGLIKPGAALSAPGGITGAPNTPPAIQ